MKLNKIYQLKVQNARYGDFVVIEPPTTVEFAIDRNFNSSQANIKVYNLGQETRSFIFQDIFNKLQGTVEFYAGYEKDGTDWSMIFTGRMLYAHSTRLRTDIITNIECQGISLTSYWSESSISQAEGFKSKADIIKKLSADMGFSDPIVGPGFTSIPFSGSRGLSLSGNTLKIMNMAISDDGNYFVDNGRGVALGYQEAFRNNGFEEINKETGLLNIPFRTSEMVEAQLLFTPQLQVGQYVRVTGYTDAHYNGDYGVMGVRHAGMISETHDVRTTTTVLLSDAVTLHKVFPL